MLAQEMFLVCAPRFSYQNNEPSTIQIFLAALKLFREKQPDLIISCILHPFQSWKLYMENKNNIFNFHPIGSSQGLEARKKKKRKEKTFWISEHMLTKGLFSGCPCSARKYFYPQPTVLLEWSTSGVLSYVLITVDRCKRNNKSFLPFTCFPDVRVLWSEVLDPSFQNGTSDFYFSFLVYTFSKLLTLSNTSHAIFCKPMGFQTQVNMVILRV